MNFIRAVALVAMAGGIVSPAMAAKPSGIGITSLVVKDVEGKTEEEIRRLVLQDSVFQNEIVQTGLESASELKFADDTRISVGPNSTIVLDEFVYDPDPGEGTFALKVTEGVFRFFSGNMASSNYKIETPTVTVGVRGTVLVMVTRGDGAVAVIMESDDGVEITSNNGDTVVLETPGTATVAFVDGTMTPPGEPPAWALWRIRDMDNILASAALPAPPPAADPAPLEPNVETAAVPPVPPAEEPTVVEDPAKRGLPRAELVSGKDKPLHANGNAWSPSPPDGGTTSTGSTNDAGGNGKGNGNGNGNGKGKGNS